MTLTAFARRDVAGGAIVTTTTGIVLATDTSIPITAATGWPTGSNGKFFCVIDPGLASEEKLAVLSRSGTTLTVQATSDRGVDGTAAAQHSSGATIRLCSTSIDADEANNAVHAILGQLAAKGDTFPGATATTLTKLGVGANGTAYVADSSQTGGINWAAPAGDLAGSYLTGPTVAAGAITDTKVAAANKDGAAGTASMRTIGTGATQAMAGNTTLATIAAPAGSVALNSQKITGLANGSAASDAAALGQVTAAQAGALAATAAAGGDLTGNYPNPTIAANKVVTASINAGAVTAAKFAAGILPTFVTFSRTGTLVTGTGTMRWRCPVAMTIQHVRLAVGTAPTGTASTPITGQSLVVDVKKNGTTVFTTQANRPTIAASANAETAITAPDVTALAAGDYLTLDINFVGSTIAGADLVAVVYCLI